MSSIGNYQNVSSWYNNVNLYSSTSGSGRTNKTQAQMSGQSKTDPMSQTLDSLVSSGTITGDQESAIKSAIESSMAEASYTRYKIQASASDSSASASSSSTQTDPLASLVEAGTLTQDQADAVKNALDEARDAQGVQPPPPPPPPPPQQGAEQISDTLSSLVDDGTIDSTTASSVLEAIKAAMESVQSS
ncbi:MAG: hypothetical protein HGA22_09545, partial [Clostridiales bacterium]|nr:hypothetical protein [Clostridiales bacterium]